MFLAFDPLFWECKDATLFSDCKAAFDNNLTKCQNKLIINPKKYT
ncbi:hypothetical protein SAMN05444412_1492 [Rhodonellum ikkaensis]|uniref:COX assembly mitochondrial protein n=1 Tax=Rhodonellum ikkaensis TaxID=336829 RepID=A0A1H3UBR5_9BACT|nr:hypothetical protein SAMN05444412_1492 [Rhodonellum ikkaensis]